VAGNWSAAPTLRCSTSTGSTPRCSYRVPGCVSGGWAEC
jgi:hypothetical protein